jgi:hypothetical protein
MDGVSKVLMAVGVVLIILAVINILNRIMVSLNESRVRRMVRKNCSFSQTLRFETRLPNGYCTGYKAIKLNDKGVAEKGCRTVCKNCQCLKVL